MNDNGKSAVFSLDFPLPVQLRGRCFQHKKPLSPTDRWGYLIRDAACGVYSVIGQVAINQPLQNQAHSASLWRTHGCRSHCSELALREPVYLEAFALGCASKRIVRARFSKEVESLSVWLRCTEKDTESTRPSRPPALPNYSWYNMGCFVGWRGATNRSNSFFSSPFFLKGAAEYLLPA